MSKWEARPEGVFDKWCVVKFHQGHAVVIADDLSPEDALLIANARAIRDALGLLLNAALEEELPESVVRMAAMEVYLASQGLGEATRGRVA